MIYAFGCDDESADALRAAFGETLSFGGLNELLALVREAPSGASRPSVVFVDFDSLFVSSEGSAARAEFAPASFPIVGIGRDSAAEKIGPAREALADWVFKPLRPVELKLRSELAKSAPHRYLKAGLELLNSYGPNLTYTECRILAEFLASPRRRASRKSLTQAIWVGLQINPKTLDVHLFNLRKKLHEHGFRIQFNREESVWYLVRDELPSANHSKGPGGN